MTELLLAVALAASPSNRQVTTLSVQPLWPALLAAASTQTYTVVLVPLVLEQSEADGRGYIFEATSTYLREVPGIAIRASSRELFQMVVSAGRIIHPEGARDAGPFVVLKLVGAVGAEGLQGRPSEPYAFRKVLASLELGVDVGYSMTFGHASVACVVGLSAGFGLNQSRRGSIATAMPPGLFQYPLAVDEVLPVADLNLNLLRIGYTF